MFTVTFKVTKKQVAAAAAAFVIAFAGGIWARSAMSELDSDLTDASTVVKVEKSPGKTSAQRIVFLESFGWKVDAEEEEIREILIPKEMDDVYQTYNELQKTQGCDLTKYGGKRCKRYSYTILNHPKQAENVQANIVVHNGKIIGGDVCSTELDGFMHGFAMESD